MVTAVVGVVLFLLSGCGCGDGRFSRELVIIDHRGDDSHYAHPIEVDTSQLGPDAVESCKDGNASWMCYEPQTVMHISPKVPIKVLIVPASQPSSTNTKAARAAG
jgi:hypothetical protein